MDYIPIIVALCLLYVAVVFLLAIIHAQEKAKGRNFRPEAIQRFLDFSKQDAILRLFYPIVAVSHILLWPIWLLATCIVLLKLWIVWALSAPAICGISLRRVRGSSQTPDISLEEANFRGSTEGTDLTDTQATSSSPCPLPENSSQGQVRGYPQSQAPLDAPTPTSTPPPKYSK